METTDRPHVLLHVTGCIAAYKACEVLRLLQKAGCEVRVAMTEAGERFVGRATFEALTRHPVTTSLFEASFGSIPHIDGAEWADLQLVAPCTADVLAKMAQGIADDAVTSTLLAAVSPVLVAPAMNVHMWLNPATQANVQTLQTRGIHFVMPCSGRLACGDIGEGKLADVEDIAASALALLKRGSSLAGMKVVVTAGPTHEAIDPVRYIANASSGKMGYAVAAEAALRGADVTLVTGPVALPCPWGVHAVSVTSAAEMYEAATSAWKTADIAVCAAAVADYAPAHASAHKLKKDETELSSVGLVRTRDILAELGRTKEGRIVVGFAAETREAISYAERKLRSKAATMIVANDVSRADSAFGSDTDRVAFVTEEGVEQLPTLAKAAVASELWNRVERLLG